MAERFRRYGSGVCALLLAVCLCVLPVAASDMAFTPFTYDEWGDPVEGPSGFEPTATVDGASLGLGGWASPTDLAVSMDGQRLYVLDGEQGRVDYCDAAFGGAGSISTFTWQGEESPLQSPRGIFSPGSGVIYVADRGNARVVRCNEQGEIDLVLEKPDNPLFPQEKEFIPVKVAVDGNGLVYVLCEGIYLGAVMYSAEGEFLGFYGSNKVEVSLDLLLDSVIKKIVNEEARELMSKYTPVEYSSLAIDREGFVYTCTITADNTQMLKKLNAGGVNILQAKVKASFQKGFGNLHPTYVDGVLNSTRFADVAVDGAGNLYGMDTTANRIFVYDSDANLLFGFAGRGTQNGLFINPVAVEMMGDKLLVLDNSRSAITVFERTEFGRLVEEAMAYYNDGRYQEAMVPWRQVLKYNANYTLAYIGIGKAQLESGNVEAALENFEIANYAAGHNEAYREFRVDGMRQYMPIFFIVVGLLLFLIYGRAIPPVARLFDRCGAVLRRVFRRKGGL